MIFVLCRACKCKMVYFMKYWNAIGMAWNGIVSV